MDTSEGEQVGKETSRIEPSERTPTAWELERERKRSERDRQAQESWEKVQKDPRSTGELLEAARRKMVEIQKKKPYKPRI